MVVLHNHFVPRQVTVNRKSHPYGNGHHTLADALTSVIYYVEIIEVRDKQK